MQLLEKLTHSFVDNPTAWLLSGLLIVAGYGNYSRGRDLTQVCTLVEPVIGPFSYVSSNPPRTAEQIAKICLERLGD